ncbi:BREX system serine/threonine kinase PglW [Streptomyces sp. NPDC059909]|uniref:BREX system serine/threonine kinase PglW n=1 Tax=Streptomyces sp. NPDC059909 TaxID=3346998 RepID=UPI00364D267A
MAAANGAASPQPKPAPKPAPPRVQRWHQTRTSPFPWEQDALDHIKRLMPQTEPYRAWATFSFTASSGRVNECDLFIAVPRGLFLVELKAHPGRLVNNGSTWSFRGSDKLRTISNPLHLTDLKSKELKGQLEWAARKLYPRLRIPRVEPAVFLSDPGLVSQLDEVQRIRVYGRDGSASGLPSIWQDLLNAPPQREEQRVTAEFARHLDELMRKIGVRASTAHLDFGDWRLAPRLLDAGDGWEDRLAKREGLVHEEGRVRVYLVELQATEAARRSTERAALREYQVLQGIAHPGIAQAVDFRGHQGGPAILFRHRHDDLRLDDYLAAHGARLTDETRRNMVRQLADALRYAHRRSLYHRALAARSIYVTARPDGEQPVLRITDWQSAARDFEATSLRSLGNSPLGGEHIQDTAEVYLAPGFDEEYADPVELDVFGLGAVAYLILTGTAPAARRSALMARLGADGGLHPYAVSDSIAASLDELVYQATRGDAADRLASVDAFLKQLDAAEQDVNSQAATVETDPLTATPGQALDAEWTVVRVLGSGATARALLVQGDPEIGAGAPQPRVLKVSLDAEKDARLHAEAAALKQVGGGRIVRLLDGPRTLGGRTVLELEYAGEQSLAQRLRGQGRLTYDDLESFGEDLFKALEELTAKGVRHRDIKPDNLGVQRGADGREHLMLFDFSLADVPDRDLKAGTKGYLDPFLDHGHRREYDDYAEHYAAAVALHEMASGERPVWGDGTGDPRTTSDEHPALAEDLFEPGLREGLTGFFSRALHRDIARRFDSLKQMSAAWRELFTHADAVPPATTPATATTDADTLQEIRDAAALAAEGKTELIAAGLSPRAVAVAAGLGASTVGELVAVPLHRFSQARGAGVLIRNELKRRHKQWTAALRRKATPEAARAAARQTGMASKAASLSGKSAAATSETDAQVVDQMTARGSVDQLASLLAPGPTRANSNKSEVLRATLGLPGEGPEPEPWEGKLPPWPTQVAIAGALKTAQPTVSRHHVAAIKEWAATGWLQHIRDELVAVLDAGGRVMTAQELAVELRVRHGAGADTPGRTLAKALAVVRAAVEAEALPDGRDEEHQPRLAVLRRGERVLIALESLPGSDAPSAPDLADYAARLGAKADELAASDPLPGRASVVRDLRAVPTPEGMAPLAETRLVALAAAVASKAAASPRLELYPRDLALDRALRISQAPAGVRRDLGITVEDLLAKVRYRFPELDFGAPTHVTVEDALKKADFPLEYDTAAHCFRPPAPSVNGTQLRSGTSTGTVTAAGGAALGAAAAGRDPDALLAGKLRGAVERGGFVALNVHLKYLAGTSEVVAGAFPVVPVNLAQVFLAEFRALAGERGTDWTKVLGADTTFTRSGELPGGLRSYVSRVWPRVGERIAETARGRQGEVVFIHAAGLLARYWEAGGRDILVNLQNAARRGGASPHGLWLLCPSESPRGASHLDRRTVEVLGEAERVVLERSFLDTLRAAAAEPLVG